MAGNGCMPGWIRGDGTSCDPKDVSQQESFTGHSSIVLERSQYGGSDVGYSKRVILNQKKAEILTLTGMSKSENVENDAPDKLSRDYAIWADVHYQDGSGENYQAKFPSGTNDWNRSAVEIPAKKPIKHIQVYLLFRNNNKGKVWFDDIRLLEGNALIKTSTTTMEMLLRRMMKKDRKTPSHMMHQEIKRAKQMKKEIQNYMITTKIIY